MPQIPESLESDVALKRLTTLAASWPESTFLSKLPTVFGRDVPVEAYRMLRKSLLDKKFSQPAVEIVTAGLVGHVAGYDNTRRTILVDRQLVSTAEKNKEQAATLLIALIEEFGHHVDNVLRTDYSRRSDDGPRDEGAELAFALCKQWLTTPLPTTFATYSSLGRTRQLSTDVNTLKNAIDRHLTAKEREDDEKAGSMQYFGAGRGHGKPGKSYGHESIEDALQDFFPDPNERRQIYFGNWLRDYSQVLDPKIVRRSTSRNVLEGFTRKALTSVLDVMARDEFGNTESFRVTPEKMGVYRAEQHIDNPHGIEDATSKNDAATSKHNSFRNKWTASEVAIDPATGMLNYIANSKGPWETSAAYIEQELRAAASLGRTVEGRRRLGQGLHTLEDFYSHSNFAEIMLIKLGMTQVYPWVHSKVSLPTPRYPLVTGKFGSNDIQVSGAYVISEQMGAVKECIPGKRSTSAKIMLILLKDIPPEQIDQQLVKKYENFLEFQESLGKKYPWLSTTLCEISNLVSALPNAVLAKAVKNHATNTTKSQDEFLKNPSSTHPTHSQLAKDHDDHPLHTLTAHLAMGAVRDVGGLMAQVWKKQRDVDAVVQAALKYLVHPEDIHDTATDGRAWILKMTRAWAKANAPAIKLLEKGAIIERQFTEAKEQLARVQSQLKAAGDADVLIAQLRGTLQDMASRA
jgi:hypothetical protein